MNTLESLEETFNRLKRNWKEETMFLSSLTAIYNNSNYQEIIAMGKRVVPLILNEYKKDMGHWSDALWTILNDGPYIDPKDYGRMDVIRKAWLAWAKEKGYTE